MSANAVAFASPLEAGRYLVTSGGTNSTINSHTKTLSGEQFAAFRGQSYAVDLIGIDRWGLRAEGISPIDPTEHIVYGRTVFCAYMFRRHYRRMIQFQASLYSLLWIVASW